MIQFHQSIKFRLALICSLFLLSCNKYLDIQPKGYTLLSTVTNYDQWLNDYKLYTIENYEYLNYPTDLVDMALARIPATTSAEMAFGWQPQYSLGFSNLWGSHYKSISGYNSVIVGIDEATGGTDRQKAELKAEAKLGRAFEYLFLINEYGKSYDSATASTDPGVPIVLTDDVAQQTPPRSTVKEVYDFIISDLNASLTYLPVNYNNRFRGTKSAAYSLLARAHLFARNYNKASEYAQLAIDHSGGRSLLDYPNLASVAEIGQIGSRKDVIYARYATASSEPSLEFMRTFNVNDMRLKYHYYNLGNYSFTTRGVVKHFYGGTAYSHYNNLGTTLQEMILIVAESAARNNELPLALSKLDDIRKFRIPAANYTPYQSNDKEIVLKWVLQERAFEFPFNGLRWFDMRRLNAEGRMGAVVRYDGLGNSYATLHPGSPRYTFQVPEYVLGFNPDMPQNP